uniref:Transposase n=1 Tax=Streptococcus suis TaxID=1307 RepID=A0A0F6UWZ3_STRSU|nr:transposase [Streptococcus suis]AKE79257.1 transposase [Streptococcus suis]AKE79282.1 transposase [Streptococcus suis]AKE79307.1 transposase [Streptococcus suis]AKE79370.1 transposase [Streptococcus suis]
MSVPVKRLESVFSIAAEEIDLTGEEIQIELTFDKVGERVNPLTHIRFPANQEDLA